MKQITFFRCFQAEVSFIGLEHLTEKMTAVASLTRVWVMVDCTLPNKNKALALIFGSV